MKLRTMVTIGIIANFITSVLLVVLITKNTIPSKAVPELYYRATGYPPRGTCPLENGGKVERIQPPLIKPQDCEPYYGPPVVPQLKRQRIVPKLNPEPDKPKTKPRPTKSRFFILFIAPLLS